jgi:CheY-like chemotaxis protein
MASLEVSDTGVGMSEDVRKHCLEPFFTTKGASGTGLGLATSLGIITRHHGAIEIDTYPGRGTRMVITLPMDEVVMASPAPMQVRVAPAMHILVVDDEELARGVVAEFLRIDGHDVEMADGAASALEKVSTDHFDLMITDRAMPERSGDRLAVDVKTLGLDLPIIMLTGFGGFMRTMGEMPDGVDLVIGKPITLAALREAMAEVTSRGR